MGLRSSDERSASIALMWFENRKHVYKATDGRILTASALA